MPPIKKNIFKFALTHFPPIKKKMPPIKMKISKKYLINGPFPFPRKKQRLRHLG